ncbi:hypothetical protein Tco_0404633 [Tanacetum coccineum]
MVQMKISLTNMNANKLLMLVQGFKEFSSDEQIMTFNHNSSELGIHDHNNKQSSSKLVPKVVPLADKTTTYDKSLCPIDPSQNRSYALSWKPCQGDSLNLPDRRIHKDGDGDALFQLKTDSLPHAHDQTTKTYYKHQVYQGSVCYAFKMMICYEHVGQEQRSLRSKDDHDSKDKDLRSWNAKKTKSKGLMTKDKDQDHKA